MTDSFIQVPPDAGGKLVDAEQLTTGSGTVQRQRVILGGTSPTDLVPATAADGLLVNLGANNDVAVTSQPARSHATDSIRLGDGTDLANVSAAGALQVDGSGVTQPVSAASLPLPTGAATAANQLPDGHNVTVDNAGGAAAVNIQDGGNSITVDVPGTVAVDQTDTAALDYDTGAGTVSQTVVGIALPGSGGPVAGGTASAPVRVDPTGTTTQPVSAASLPLPTGAATAANQLPDGHNVTVDNAGGAAAVNIQDGGNSITVDAANDGSLTARIGDGTLVATVRDTGTSDSLNVAVVDAAGNQITSFGGGTQYAEDTAHASGDQVTMAGVVQQTADAALSGDGDRSLLQVDASGFLKVNVKAGSAGGPSKVDDSAFGVGADSVAPMGALADETAPDPVDEGDVGIPRMTLDRKLLTRVVGATDANRLDVDAAGLAQVDVAAASPLTASGSLGATGTVASLAVGGFGAAAIQLSGTWVAGVSFQVTVNGTDWFNVECRLVVAGNAATHATGSSVNCIAVVPIQGAQSVRAECTSFTSGTIVADIRAIPGAPQDVLLHLWNAALGVSMGDTLVTPIFAQLSDGVNNLHVAVSGTPIGAENGILAIAERDDVLGTLTPEADGQFTNLRTDSQGALWSRLSQPAQISDGTDTAQVTAAGELNVLATAQPGVDVGDVTVNNAAGASAVNVQDGGNSLTVDAPVGTPVNVQIGDGSQTADVTLAGELDTRIGDIRPKTASGSIAATGTLVSIDCEGYGSVALQLSGTWTAIVFYEATVDNTNWFIVNSRQYDAATTGGLAFGSQVNCIAVISVAGARAIRARVATYTSGTIVGDMRAIPAAIKDGGTTLVALDGSIMGVSNPGAIYVRTSDGTAAVDPARSQNDDTAFAAGQDNNPTAMLFDSTPPTITDGNVGIPRMNSARVAMGDLSHVAGTAVAVNTGNADAGTQRVVLASNQPVVEVVGDVAHDAAAAGNPVLVGVRANQNEPTAVADADASYLWGDQQGRVVIAPHFPANAASSTHGPISVNATASGNTTVVSAPGASLSVYVVGFWLSNQGTSKIRVGLTDGAGGTTRYRGTLAADGGGVRAELSIPWKLSANTALVVNLGAAGDVDVSVEFFVAP